MTDLKFLLFLVCFAVLASAEAKTGSDLPIPENTDSKKIEEVIKKSGKTPPGWWDSVPLKYPKTLNLNWPEPPQGSKWNVRLHIGHYMWSVINENSRFWKQGTKFMHYVYKQNEDNPAAKQKAIEALAHCYHDLLEDWARGAYWYEQIENQRIQHVIALSHCYWKLGDKDRARTNLSRIKQDWTRYGGAIKLWSDFGDLKKALELSKNSQSSNFIAATMGAADALRSHGRYEEAIELYKKVINTTGDDRNGIPEQNRKRARRSIENIKMYEAFDIKKIKSGIYTAQTLAYNGPLSVEVIVKRGEIKDVKVTKHREKQYYSALTDTPAKIIAKQSVMGIHATTGATITSEAIVSATAKALL